ncbi:MAG TPA: glycosyltransferase family 4 protein [Bryobacteraceae bacterium]|jgi:glycosyltransferase involved in cell wall biosynthesis|nr:glycosyltransferase family 4 protein [Bryobacteraceae bacterium]
MRPLQKIKYVRTLVTSALYAIRLVANIAKYDILHIFTPGYFAFMLAPTPAILLAKVLGKKTILNYRDGRAEDHLIRWPSAIRVLRLVDEIVAPSNFLVHVFSRFGLPARSIPNIVDLEQFRFRQRNRPRPAFLHNRGLEPLYNVPCTIRAFALIQERYPDASLTIAHDGPLRKQLEQMASHLGLRNAKFIGNVSREQTPVVYDEADIYLTNPDIDNMPVSVLECFAAGLPIISTRVGGVPYILEHERTGLLVDRDDHVGIAQAAFRLLEEPGLAARLTGNGREECGKYAPASVAAAWLALYTSLAAGENLNAAQELHNAPSPARTHGSSPR